MRSLMRPPAARAQRGRAALRRRAACASQRARSAIASSLPRPAHSILQLGGEPLGRQVAIRDQHRGALAHQELRVDGLVVVDRGRKRHQHRAPRRRRRARKSSARRRGRSRGRRPHRPAAMSSMKGETSRRAPALARRRRARRRCRARPPGGAPAASRPGLLACANGTTALRRDAPRLPPTTSRRSAPSRRAKRSAGGGCMAISARTGLPTTLRFDARRETPSGTLPARGARDARGSDSNSRRWRSARGSPAAGA